MTERSEPSAAAEENERLIDLATCMIQTQVYARVVKTAQSRNLNWLQLAADSNREFDPAKSRSRKIHSLIKH